MELEQGTEGTKHFKMGHMPPSLDTHCIWVTVSDGETEGWWRRREEELEECGV